MKTVPLTGSMVPAPSWDLAKARAKSWSRPMTSPVERISGPSRISTPGKRANGNTASLTAVCGGLGPASGKLFSLSPAITRAAILAMAVPVALATKGTVRLARGLTSRMNTVSPWMANWMFISPTTWSALASWVAWAVISAIIGALRV